MADTLVGQTAIVTGAGRGFGAAIATGLARAGASVALISRTKLQLDHVARKISDAGGTACVAEADVSNPEEVVRAVQTVERQTGPATLLVYSAGLAGPFGPLGYVDVDSWWHAQAVHLLGPLLFLTAVLPRMRERKAGRIIVVSAIAGRLVTPNLSAYGMGKASQIRLIQQIHAENLDYGISAFAIEPGTAITEMAESTIASLNAQRWLPGMVQRLKEMKSAKGDSALVFNRCAERCINLASGRYDRLSGRYIEPADDLDAMLSKA
jgi:NAD(P)-dependent dehydrogenase (short-subunit alcohol dehydrogenase family)